VPAAAAFRTASVTKTFTAAACLLLVDCGDLVLDGPIAGHLPAWVRPLLPRLVAEPESVTLRQLLQHTSGAGDYAEDERFQAGIAEHPDRRYDAEEILRWTAENLSPSSPVPGQSRYSDTGYVLAAEAMTVAARRPFAAALRELLDFSGRGLSSTWLEEREPQPVPPPPLAPSNVNGADVWSFHPSYDTVGGGGLASTASDVRKFFVQLMDGRVVPQHLLQEMQSALPSDNEGLAGLGLFRRTTPLGAAWGHTGFHGGFAYVTDDGTAVAGSVCSVEPEYGRSGPREAVLAALADVIDAR
jgi:D-alanyl-D-alanine carboxypeptidase